MTSSETTPSVELVKWAEALEAVQGDRELLRTVVEAALEEIPQVLLAIRESIASQDGARLHRSAHTLKSSLRYFGAQDAAEKAWQLESDWSRGESCGVCRDPRRTRTAGGADSRGTGALHQAGK